MAGAAFPGTAWLQYTMPAADPFSAVGEFVFNSYSTTGGSFTPYFFGMDNSSVIGIHNSLFAYGSNANDTDGTSAAPATGTPIVCAIRRSANLHDIFIAGAATPSPSVTNSADNSANFVCGAADAAGDLPLNGEVLWLKAWSAALSNAELQAEAFTRKPIRWANLEVWNGGMDGANLQVNQAGKTNMSKTGTLTDAARSSAKAWQRRGGSVYMARAA